MTIMIAAVLLIIKPVKLVSICIHLMNNKKEIYNKFHFIYSNLTALFSMKKQTVIIFKIKIIKIYKTKSIYLHRKTKIFKCCKIMNPL